VNTFDMLELEVLRAISTLNLVGIGPLIPFRFLDAQDRNSSDESSRGDHFQGSNEYVQWLNTKKEASVIYVAFGSIAKFSKAQKLEIAHGLLETGRPFLWVVRKTVGDDDELIYKEELDKRGVIIPWCSQMEVLSHRSIGCFFTHCGWNSTMEGVSLGVPMVVMPQWTDQPTNAAFITEVWKVGLRVRVDEKGIVTGEEIESCVNKIMGGERGKEIKANSLKWRERARIAMEESGSSDNNISDFVKNIIEMYK